MRPLFFDNFSKKNIISVTKIRKVVINIVKNKFKKLLSIALSGIMIGSVAFSSVTASAAAPSTLDISGVSDFTWTFNDGGSNFTIRRRVHKTSDGRAAYCILPSQMNSPLAGRTSSYAVSGTIDGYSMSSISEKTAPTANFVRSVIYYGEAYFGANNITETGYMGVQLALHKYPVNTWARATARVPFNRDSDNPIAEINNNCGGYSSESIAISYAEALTYKAQNYPVSNREASVSLARTGGGYIDGNNYIVATYRADGDFDNCSFWTEGTSVYLWANGNYCTLYYPLNEVPANYNITLKVGASRPNYEVYVYTKSGMQSMGVGGAGENSYREDSVSEYDAGNGKISLYKKDASTGALLSGTVFKITNQNTGAEYYKMTDSNGYTDVSGLPYGYYTVEEAGAPYGYYIGADEWGNTNRWTDIALTASNSSVTLTAYNLKQSGRIKIIKTDAETGYSVQGEAMLTNGVFEISNDNGVVETLTMSGANEVTSGLLPLGKYYVKEIAAPTGYNLNSESKEVWLSSADQTVLYTSAETTISDTVIKGTVSIHKTGEEKYTVEGKTVNLKGAVFSVYDVNNQIVSTITTDENGNASTQSLPYGTYRIKETSVPEGYKACSNFELMINENKNYHYELTNEIYKDEIKIIKKDKTTNKVINLSETEFKIVNEKGVTIKIGNKDRFKTTNGVLVLPKKLTYGKYTLIETKAPAGYLLDTGTVSFVVNENSGSVVTVEKKDTPLMGKIKISKTGDTFTDIETETTEYGETNKPVFKNSALSNITFEILSAEDIKTADGTVRYPKNTVVSTVTTKNGTVTSKSLYLGKYVIREKETLKGYKLDKKEYPIEITNDGSREFSLHTFSLNNDKAKTSITLVKNAEKWIGKSDDNKNVVTRKIETLPGEGFIFGLYADEDIKTYKGDKTIKKDSLIAIGSTDKNGKLEFDIDVPFAKYYIKELHAPEIHFNLSNKKYNIDLTTEKTDGSTVVAEITEPILNDFDKYEVKITKKDLTTGEAVSGALIEISDEEGNVIYRDYTSEDGLVPDVILEPGKYTFKEVLAPNGYALNTSVFNFELKEDGTVEGDTEITDDYTRFKVIKTDENGNPLKGVGFGLYDTDGNLVSEVFTDENGIAEFVRFSEGKYEIKETKALDGYTAITDAIATVENNGTYLNDDNTQKVNVTNKKIPLAPQTGDNTPVIWLAVIAAISAMTTVFFFTKLKKEEKESGD